MTKAEGILMQQFFLSVLFTLGFICSAFADDLDKGLMAYNNGDYETALDLWSPFAEQGNAWAQVNLGFMYEYGKGVPEDNKEAVKWYTLAAEQGNARAQANLGFMYEYGKGVPEDNKEAVKWYTLAAEQGNARAQANLGFMYQYGKGVPEDNKEAVKWYTLAAEQGDAFGQGQLGGMYQYGKGVPEDNKEAVKWYTLAAEQGNKNAKLSLKSLFFSMGNEIFSAGLGGHDCIGAIELFRKAKEFGNSSAHEYIKFCKMYQSASEENNEAQYQIALHFLEGTLVQKNTDTALSWAMKAIENGNKNAGDIVTEILIHDLVYGSDVQKLRDLGQVIETICSNDPQCAFDKIWEYLDISEDGNLSIAEISKFQRNLVKFAYVEEMQDKVAIEEVAAINLTTILLLPITSSSILHSFDYNNDGTLQKEEVFGETEFAKLVGIDAQSLISGVEFQTLGNKLNDAMKNLPLPF